MTRHNEATQFSPAVQPHFVTQITHQLTSSAKQKIRGPEYSHSLLAERYGDRIPVQARFSAPVHIGAGTHISSHTFGTVSFTGYDGWDVA